MICCLFPEPKNTVLKQLKSHERKKGIAENVSQDIFMHLKNIHYISFHS